MTFVQHYLADASPYAGILWTMLAGLLSIAVVWKWEILAAMVISLLLIRGAKKVVHARHRTGRTLASMGIAVPSKSRHYTGVHTKRGIRYA